MEETLQELLEQEQEETMWNILMEDLTNEQY